MSDRAERYLEQQIEQPVDVAFPAILDALLAVGALTPDSARVWRAEHTRRPAAPGVPLPPVEEAQQLAAGALLEELLDEHRAGDAVAMARLRAALDALRGVHALTAAAARAWLERLLALAPPARVPAEPAGGPEAPEVPFGAGRLTAVPIGPPDRHEGRRVTGLELYDDMTLARFHWVLGPEPADPVARRELLEAPLTLADDVGTTYEKAQLPSGSCPDAVDGAWPEVLVGWTAFLPAAPLTARAFAVGWRGHAYPVALAPDDA